jgi:hypothetical protein
MKYFDVFNGDADGICGLHQLRLAAPLDAILITGVKRDIALLERVPAAGGDSVTVLDISLDVNRAALLALLRRGVKVEYFDHHAANEIPQHAGLHAVIDTTADVCTSMLVDRHLGGAHRVWAVVGAFGDNLAVAARKLAESLSLQAEQTSALQELGECLNYNAYADSEADLFVHPAALYASLHRHADPFDFICAEPMFRKIREGRRQDLEKVRLIRPHTALPCGKIYILPDAAWSRRVRGAFGNDLATGSPGQAHAVLTCDAQSGYVASVRAPLAAMRGADDLCRQFQSGGGRAAAAGINHLPRGSLPAFVRAFDQAFGRAVTS